MKFSIDVPAVEHWVAATGMPLSRRDEIIGFVARRVRQEQAFLALRDHRADDRFLLIRLGVGVFHRHAEQAQ